MDTVFLHHLVVDHDVGARTCGAVDAAAYEGETFFVEGQIKCGLLDAVFEEGGAGDGGEDVEGGGFDDAGAPGVGDDYTVAKRCHVRYPHSVWRGTLCCTAYGIW